MNINYLKKILKYRLSYSGTKETDILYKKLILAKLNNFKNKELNLLISLFNEYSDDDIFSFLTNRIDPPIKFKSLISKILYEK
tara:strand:+ start:17 stop:265 length:249 start_codon:yes stop_codon:yes gene_type:complete